MMLMPDSAIVTYTVNAFESAERAGQVCLLRGAELIAQSDDRYFAIVGSRRTGVLARWQRPA